MIRLFFNVFLPITCSRVILKFTNYQCHIFWNNRFKYHWFTRSRMNKTQLFRMQGMSRASLFNFLMFYRVALFGSKNLVWSGYFSRHLSLLRAISLWTCFAVVSVTSLSLEIPFLMSCQWGNRFLLALFGYLLAIDNWCCSVLILVFDCFVVLSRRL